MTPRTHRRLFTCLVVVALTLPAESILLRAISPSTAGQDVRNWADTLSRGEVDAAAAHVQAFPFKYRREIMRRLTPAGRAQVWRRHIQSYISRHTNLDESVKALLYNAASLATAEVFDHPTEATRTQVGIVAEQLKILIGKDDAEDLFYRLGPRDSIFMSGFPIARRVSDFVRARFVVEALAEDCECTPSFGCGELTHCSAGHGCIKDDSWPMCGWWWNTVCDGLCSAGYEGS